jgi:hypothetical protein
MLMVMVAAESTTSRLELAIRVSRPLKVITDVHLLGFERQGIRLYPRIPARGTGLITFRTMPPSLDIPRHVRYIQELDTVRSADEVSRNVHIAQLTRNHFLSTRRRTT